MTRNGKHPVCVYCGAPTRRLCAKCLQPVCAGCKEPHRADLDAGNCPREKGELVVV